MLRLKLQNIFGWLALLSGLSACSDSAFVPSPPLHYSQDAQFDSFEKTESYLRSIENNLVSYPGSCEKNEKFDRRKLLNAIRKYDEQYQTYLVARKFEQSTGNKKETPAGAETGKSTIVVKSRFVNITPSVEYLPSALGDKAMSEHLSEKVLVKDLKRDYFSFTKDWAYVQDQLDILDNQPRTAGVLRFDSPQAEKKFVALVTYVKRIISDDYWRIVNYWDFSSGHNTLVLLNRMNEILQNEKIDERTPPYLQLIEEESKDFREFWNSNPYVKKYLYTHYKDNYVINLKGFRTRVAQWTKRRFGRKRTNIDVLSENSIDVILDPFHFAGAERYLQAWFDSAWNVYSDFNFNLKWVDSSIFKSSIFTPMKLVYRQDYSATEHVSNVVNEMRLKPGFLAETYMHEMGHVLGLPDEYYTLWDTEKCEYRVFQASQSIMASNGGPALPDHLERIKALYGVGNQTVKIGDMK